MAAPENKKGVRQCPKTLQDAFILSGLPAAVGEPPGNVCQGLLSKGCARFNDACRGGCASLTRPTQEIWSNPVVLLRLKKNRPNG
ncbi:hypothetical protein ACVULY_002020, partial [Cronobacter turicensis]